MERLTVGDLTNFWAEGPTTPMHIALAGVLAPGSLVDADGRFQLEEARDRVRRRLSRAPGLARRVHWTRFGEGPPGWVHDEVEIEHHVDAVVGASMTEAELVEWCANDVLRPFDRARPLWRIRFIPGIDAGNVGILVVVHHAVADGLRGVAMIGGLLDDSPGVEIGNGDPAALSRVKGQVPGSLALVIDNVKARLKTLWGALRGLPGAPRRVLTTWRSMRLSLDEMKGNVPRTPLVVDIGPTRRLLLIRRQLHDVKSAAHRRGVSLNDVVLASVAVGLRAWLGAMHVRVDAPLRVSVPLGASASNAGGVMLVPLPVNEPDDEKVLSAISAFTREAKLRHAEHANASWDLSWAPLSFSMLWVKWLRSFGRDRVNAYVTNVPGPVEPLYLGDARLLSATPIAPLVAGVALSLAVFSYAGALSVAVHVDGHVPETKLLADEIGVALARLTSA